jgi:hypothetical protein
MIWIFCLLLALVFSLVNIIFLKKPRTAGNVIEIILLYLFVFQIGLMSFIAFIAHVFRGPEIAALVGWQPGNPFQYEVGMMNLGLAVLGFLCIWFRKEFWLATAIIAAVTMAGCGVGHVREIIVNNNWAPGNAGLGIWLQTVLVPITLLVLVYFYRRSVLKTL